MKRELPTITPSSTPTATPIAKPAIVVHSVFHAWPAIAPACWTSDWTICTGDGTMKSEMSNAQQTNCQTTRIAADRIHGAHFSSDDRCAGVLAVLR